MSGHRLADFSPKQINDAHTGSLREEVTSGGGTPFFSLLLLFVCLIMSAERTARRTCMAQV